MEEKDKEKNKYDQQVDRVRKVLDSIPMKKVSVLTGENGSGKSMIRKLMWSRVRDAFPDGRDPHRYVAEVSMDRRTGKGFADDCMRAFSPDTMWDPTSVATCEWLRHLMSVKNRFIVVDEIEIGLSEELQLSVAERFNEAAEKAAGDALGFLVITHSRIIARNVRHDAFFNLQGMSEEEWLNREIKPTDIDQLNEDSNRLYDAFQKRLKPEKF